MVFTTHIKDRSCLVLQYAKNFPQIHRKYQKSYECTVSYNDETSPPMSLAANTRANRAELFKELLWIKCFDEVFSLPELGDGT